MHGTASGSFFEALLPVFFWLVQSLLVAMQLMIYVGGTLVLLVFGVMLTAQTQLVALRTPAGDRVIAGILAAHIKVCCKLHFLSSRAKPVQGGCSP